MRNIVLIGCAFFLICSCTKTNPQYAKLIEEQYMLEDDLIDAGDTSSYKIIYLETNDSVAFGAIDLFLMNDCGIFIVSNQTIKIYDKNGKYISSINKQGNDFGEYFEIKSIAVENYIISVLDANHKRIIDYDFYGNILSISNLKEYRGSTFSKLNNQNYLFYMPHEGYSPRNGEVLLTDLNGEIIKEYIQLKDYGEKRRFNNANYFSTQTDGIYFIPTFEDKLYRINSKLKMEEIFNLGFKSKMMSFEDVTDRPAGSGTDKYTYFSDFEITDNGVFMTSISKNSKSIFIIVDINKKLLRTTLYNNCGSYKNYMATFSIPNGVSVDIEKGEPLILINTEKINFTKE